MNGSPRKENTAAGHQAEILHVGPMKIAGCLGCEYCHGKGAGKRGTIRKGDSRLSGRLFDLLAQISAAIQRVYR